MMMMMMKEASDSGRDLEPGAGDRDGADGEGIEDVGDGERPPDERLVPRPAPGIGPIGPAGDPSYMEGTLRGKGPRVGFYVTAAVVAALVALAIALVLGG